MCQELAKEDVLNTKLKYKTGHEHICVSFTSMSRGHKFTHALNIVCYCYKQIPMASMHSYKKRRKQKHVRNKET